MKESASNQQENEAFLSEEGIICVFYNGDQTSFKLRSLLEVTQKMADELERSSRPIIAIIDHTNIGKLPPPSEWKIVIEALRKAEYDKVGIVVKNTFIMYVSKFVVAGIGKKGKFGFFYSQETAKKWLMKE